MSLLRSLLPKLLVFGVAVVISAAVASVAVAALQDRTPRSTAGVAPEAPEAEYTLAGADTPAGSDTPAIPGPIVAFNEQPAGEPSPLPSLSPEDLGAASAALLGGEPVSFVNPSGFPRIPPITQFDGGPFQGANCTLASGAMLARLGSGIVTSGSILRTLQDDQDGGTGINDLAQALWRGYGVHYSSGLLRPEQLKSLLGAGYGAVIQGDYSKIPRALRLQKNFTGGHAIYLDGYYPGSADSGIPEAYYVIDPIGRPRSGYEGDWWPASVVDEFAGALGGGRVRAMWAFPPGGVPPEVTGPDVLPIPPDTGGGQPTTPGETPSPSSTIGPSVAVEPGDVTAELPPAEPPVSDPGLGGLHLVPLFDICLITPRPSGCPTGIEAVFSVPDVPVLRLSLGPTIDVLFVDSDRANVAIVGFTVDPPAAADVHFWEVGVSPGDVHSASSMSSMVLFGKTVQLARLDTKAATTYRFQVLAGSGVFAGQSTVGSFTTGAGVEQFDVTLSQVSSPLIKVVGGYSPYLHQGEGAFAQPMIPLASLGGETCVESADFGGLGFCLKTRDAMPAPAACARVEVSYALSGIDADSVAVRAFPAVEGVIPPGDMTLDGVIEASGPVPAGSVSVGCLAPGLTYNIALDAIGDDRGVLAVKSITVP
jgi:hypothetical protein